MAAATDYTYTAADSDENNAGSDTATLMFSITITEPDTAPAFAVTSIAAQTYDARHGNSAADPADSHRRQRRHHLHADPGHPRPDP